MPTIKSNMRSTSKSLTFYLWMSEVITCVLLAWVFNSVTCEFHGASSIPPQKDHHHQAISTTRLDTPGPLPSLCHRTCRSSVNGTRTWMFCETQDVLRIEGRCCINTTHGAKSSDVVPVLGIDLQDCDIVEEEFATGIQNLSILAVISLEGNPMKNITVADFNKNNGIIYLSLPANMTCPGGTDAWSEIKSESTRTVCLQELSPCHYQNISCPTNSHCVQAGIHQTECLCNVGYHGYKCLNQGSFPFIPYAVGVVVPTAVLGLLLWLTQRRYVKPKTK